MRWILSFMQTDRLYYIIIYFSLHMRPVELVEPITFISTPWWPHSSCISFSLVLSCFSGKTSCFWLAVSLCKKILIHLQFVVLDITCELKCFSSELDGFSCVRLHQIRSLLCSWLIWLFVSGMMETSVAMAAQLTETMDTTHWIHSFHCLCSCSNHITCNFLHEPFHHVYTMLERLSTTTFSFTF